MPLVVQGELQGLLHLNAPGSAELLPDRQTLAVTFGETLKLSLANLKLRETLREQAIRDALTDLPRQFYTSY